MLTKLDSERAKHFQLAHNAVLSMSEARFRGQARDKLLDFIREATDPNSSESRKAGQQATRGDLAALAWDVRVRGLEGSFNYEAAPQQQNIDLPHGGGMRHRRPASAASGSTQQQTAEQKQRACAPAPRQHSQDNGFADVMLRAAKDMMSTGDSDSAAGSSSGTTTLIEPDEFDHQVRVVLRKNNFASATELVRTCSLHSINTPWSRLSHRSNSGNGLKRWICRRKILSRRFVRP